MNPKTTEFLAQDRIAAFHREAAGHHVEQGGRVAPPKASDPTASNGLNTIALVWYRIRRAGAG